LAWAGSRAAKTKAVEVGDMMISMLRGEEGRQARELDELITWLKPQAHPDVVCLSNALLVGLARKLKAELRTKVVCTLQGEDAFVDSLPDANRDTVWQLLRERAADVDLFIAPSQYFAEIMKRRLQLPPEKIAVVYNGISLDGYEVRGQRSEVGRQVAPGLGYLARMSKDKGLDTLVEAYILLKQRNSVPRLKLQIGGSCGPGDEPFVKSLRKRLAEAGYSGEVGFFPNLTRAEKVDFLQGLTVFSVPTTYGEAFGLYLIEALAAGVPVVQPHHAAFPELIEATGGGRLCEPDNPEALADEIEKLLRDPAQAQALGQAGQKTVFERFSVAAMARETLRVFEFVNRKS
jgi:glycosyltransferase involved in cell wall biosynthesis